MNKQEIKEKAKNVLPRIGIIAGGIVTGYCGLKLLNKVIDADQYSAKLSNCNFRAIASMLDQHDITPSESVGYKVSSTEAKEILNKWLSDKAEDTIVDFAIQTHVDMK